MKFLKQILHLFIALFTGIFSIAQQIENKNIEDKYRTVHLDIDDGLSQGVVTSMLKDVNGFLWIGTEAGLNRFDGNTFKIYFTDKNKKNKTIIGDNINSLIEDSLHNIWIGTDKGLSCYDIKADTFKNFPSSIGGQSIVAFWATKEEVFCWDYPESQLAAYNIHSFTKRTLVKLNVFSDSVGYAVTDKAAIFDASSNSVWMVKGIPGWAGGTGGGLLQISLTNGKRQNFTWSCYRKMINHSHFSQGMRYDRVRNSIWLNSPDGLIEFTLRDKKFHHTDALNKWVNVQDFGDWAGIDIDVSGRVWIGTTPSGIIIYNPLDNSARLAFPNDSVLQNTVSDANVTIYCDEYGMVWSGFWTRKGVYQLIPFSEAVTRYTTDTTKPHSLSNDQVYNCVNADHNNIWIGTADGLNIFNVHTCTFQVFREKDLPGFSGKTIILPISVDTSSQKAWLSNHESPALFQMDIPTKKCRLVIFKDNANRTISKFDYMWPKPFKNRCAILTKYANQQSIFIANGDSAVAKQILVFSQENINWFCPSEDDHFIFLRRPVSFGNLTYTNLNGKWIQTHIALDSVEWSNISYSKADKTYWVIVERELLHYDKDFKLIRRYTQQDGIPDIEIINVITDNRGNAWFNTDRSIFLLNIKTGIITKLSEKDGFQRQNFVGLPTPLIKDINGDLYFPCGRVWGKGFDKVRPGKFIETYPPSTVYLQSLEINQDPLAICSRLLHHTLRWLTTRKL